MTDMDQEKDEDRNRVTIMTIHASKGLEFKHLVIAGVEEELFPSQMSLDNPKDLEEERRLFYVALTRAKVRCYLAWGRINRADTSAPAYLLHGGTGQRAASPTDDQVLLLKEHFAAKTDAEVGEDIRRLCDNSRNIIQMVPLPESLDRQTDVMLTNFEAEIQGQAVLLSWETASEIDNLGFNLYRASAPDGPYVKINQVLIAAEGDPVAGEQACRQHGQGGVLVAAGLHRPRDRLPGPGLTLPDRLRRGHRRDRRQPPDPRPKIIFHGPWRMANWPPYILSLRGRFLPEAISKVHI